MRNDHVQYDKLDFDRTRFHFRVLESAPCLTGSAQSSQTTRFLSLPLKQKHAFAVDMLSSQFSESRGLVACTA